MAIKKSNTLGLNINGSDGYTSILSTSKLFIKSDIESNDIDLFIKNKPSGGYLTHKTNWDFSLKPPVNTNYIANGDLEFSLSDYSSNPTDDYYSYTNGRNAIEYFLSANWEINDIVGIDDITVLGISNWTSTEKIILDNYNTRNAKIKSYAIGKYDVNNITGDFWHELPFDQYTVYNYVVTVYRTDLYCDTSGGTLTINFDYGLGTSSVSTTIGDSGDVAYIINIQTTTPYPTPLNVADLDYTYDGSPDVIIISGAQCVTDFEADTPATEVISIQAPVPDGAVKVGNYYYFPDDFKVYPEYDTTTKTLTKQSYDITFNLATCPCGSSPETLIVEWDENGTTRSEVVCNPTNGHIISIDQYDNPDVAQDYYNKIPRVYIDGTEYDFNSCFTKGAVTESSVAYRGAIYDTVRSRVYNGSTWREVAWYSTPKYLKNIPTYTYAVAALPVGSFKQVPQYGTTTKYTPPVFQSTRRLNFILTNLSSLFKIQSPSDKEYLDYSDIFIEVTYSTARDNCQFYDERTLYTDVVEDGKTKVYKFGGNILLSELLLNNSSNDDVNVLGDDESHWKIIVDDDKNTVGILLSSYMTNWNLKQYAYNDVDIPTDIDRDFIDGKLPIEYGVVDYKNVSAEEIKVYKVVNFPNCGKIDIYTKLTGNIENVASSIITSQNHNLQDGDIVKITGVTSSSLSSQTNLNGVFTIVKIDSDRFKLKYNAGSEQITVVNVGNITDAQWTRINDSGWKYQTSVYSPCGKNGYSTKEMQLLNYQENAGHAGDDIYQRGYEYVASIDTFMSDGGDNYSLPEVKYPQGYFDGRRSWNNFYPFMRFKTTDALAYGIINGNKFGHSIAIKKYTTNEYILAVSEPGSTESFQIIDFQDMGLTNKKVIPSYLPYGRIHFYKLTKTPKSQQFNIEYLNSISKTDNPWATYELNNKNYKMSNYDKTQNYTIDEQNIVLSLNQTTNSYWIGSRYVSWAQPYNYNQTYNVYLPDVQNNPYEFGYVDFFGKSIDFDIVGDVIYCAASTNVKNANFLTNSRVSYVDTTLNYFNYNISTNVFSSISSINNQNTTVLSDPVKQYEEYSRFGTKVVVNGNRVFWGWPGKYKENDYLYYYQRSGNTYSLVQTFTSNINSNFGAYIVAKDDFLLTNKKSYTDDSGSSTTNPVDYIQVYRYYSLDNVYSYDSRIGATFDLSNPIYVNVNNNFYEETNNISYDNTVSNSASYITELTGRYDIYDNILILRDPYEIVYLHYNYEINKFEARGHQFIGPNDAKNTIVKIFPSYAAATFDTATDYDLGEFSSSLQIINGSQFVTTSELLYGVSTDVQNPEYLPFFMKNIEGYGSGNVNLHMQANHSSGNLELFYKVFDGVANNAELYIHPPIIHSGNLELYSAGKAAISNNVSLVMRNTYTSNNVKMYIENGDDLSGLMPLYLHIPKNIVESSNVVNLALEASYTGVPNCSGSMFMTIATYQYDDHANYIPFSFVGNKTNGNSVNMNTYSSGGSSSGEISTVELFINSQPIKSSGFLPLLIDRPIINNLNLIVYNTVTGTGLNLYTSGINKVDNQVEVSISGSQTVTENKKLYIKGIINI